MRTKLVTIFLGEKPSKWVYTYDDNDQLMYVEREAKHMQADEKSSLIGYNRKNKK